MTHHPHEAGRKELGAACRWLSERTGQQWFISPGLLRIGQPLRYDLGCLEPYLRLKAFPDSLDSMRLLLEVMTPDEWERFHLALMDLLIPNTKQTYYYWLTQAVLQIEPNQLFRLWCAAVGDGSEGT